MNLHDSVYIAGHRGLIGSAIFKLLKESGHSNIICRHHSELDLTNSKAVDEFFGSEKPQFVFLAAGKVGGIMENKEFPADFIRTNLQIQLNVLSAAQRSGVKRLIFFGSSCMYPKVCAQPMSEEMLLTGHPERTSIAYAVAKLAGVEMCLAMNSQYGKNRFIPLIPNSAYGPNDDFEPTSGHVLSVLLRRFHQANEENAPSVTLWGTGNPRREFIFAEDIARASVMIMNYQGLDNIHLPLNVGTGSDISIYDLAQKVAQVVGYRGKVLWDKTKPDGAPQKLLDSSRIEAMGWSATTDLNKGLKETYAWFLQNEI
jgi:GDP-L-fucose synthase